MWYRLLGLLLLIYLCQSCSKKKPYVLDNKGDGVALDSIMLSKDTNELQIEIGTYLNPCPLSSQVIEDCGTTMYLMLDKNVVYVFDIYSSKEVKQYNVSNCGELNNYSGFTWCSDDSLFVYNYRRKEVYLLDSTGKICNRWNIKKGTDVKYPVDAEAITYSPILKLHSSILLSGSPLSPQVGVKASDKPVSCSINLKTNKVAYKAEYPEQYRLANWGGLYLNTICHDTDHESCYYSFPADHYIHKYSEDFSHHEKIYMGSRYIKSICSLEDNLSDFLKNKEHRIRYYIGQPSYGRILYDKYRNCLYRIAYQPLNKWKVGTPFEKPFSIIVMNIDGKIVSETSVFTDYEDLNLDNMHVTAEGLLIQKQTSNENIILFCVYKLNK